MTKISVNSAEKPSVVSIETGLYSTVIKEKKGRKSCYIVLLVLLSLAIAAGCLYLTVKAVQRVTCWTDSEDGADNSNGTDQFLASSIKQQTPFSFDDIFDSSLRPRGFDGSWISGQESYIYRDRDGNVQEVHAETGQETLIMANTVFPGRNTATYYVSPDRNYVLLPYERTNVWRYSYKAKYMIYIVGAPEGEDLIDFPQGPLMGETLDFARWASVGNGLSFVYENNLYIQTSPTSDPVQITTTGEVGNVFNGIPDWLYEEEIVGSSRGHYWSPDASRVAFGTFDADNVPEFEFPWYGPKSNIYGSTYKVRYPKAGAEDGERSRVTDVTMYVVDVTDPGTHVQVPVPEELEEDEHYFYNLNWKDNTHIMVTWMNRLQNHAVISICDVTNMNCVKNYENSEDDGWVRSISPRFIDGGNSYLTVIPRDQGAEGTWRQVALITSQMSGLGEITYLTSGEDEVASINGFDSTNRYIYYVARAGHTTDRHLFRVGIPGAEDPDPVCLTCSDECRYVAPTFSDSATYFFYRCSGPNITTFVLNHIDDGSVRVIEDNADVAERLSEKLLPTRTFLHVDIGEGLKGQAEMFIPPNHEPGNRYPMIVYAYAGPDGNRVSATFPMGSNTVNWLRYLGSSHGVLVASIDGRGSAGRGEEFKRLMYRKLGTVEVEDQMIGADYLKTLDEVDETEPAAIFGWSYGGFVVAHAIANDSQSFQCGLAVAPVTTYRYYDAAYTEKYMAFDTEEDNAAGYDRTDVMNKADLFEGKKFLVAHGSGDDNVHYQHTSQLIAELTRIEYQFRQLMYVDENHGIGGRSRHLYQALTDALLEDCWPDHVEPHET